MNAKRISIAGAVSATFALFVAALLLPLPLLGLLHSGFKLLQLVLIGISAALSVSAVIAFYGGSFWFLRAAWVGLIACFIASNPPAGLMDGGIVVLPIFAFIIAGLVLSLYARHVPPTGTV
jgi:hypothetical protein